LQRSLKAEKQAASDSDVVQTMLSLIGDMIIIQP